MTPLDGLSPGPLPPSPWSSVMNTTQCNAVALFHRAKYGRWKLSVKQELVLQNNAPRKSGFFRPLSSESLPTKLIICPCEAQAQNHQFHHPEEIKNISHFLKDVELIDENNHPKLNLRKRTFCCLMGVTVSQRKWGDVDNLPHTGNWWKPLFLLSRMPKKFQSSLTIHFMLDNTLLS